MSIPLKSSSLFHSTIWGLIAVAASFCLPPTKAAESSLFANTTATFFVPANYDLEGTWRLPPAPGPIETSFPKVLGGAGLQPVNYAHLGYDHFVLKKAGLENTNHPGSGFFRYVTLRYTGKYYHRHAMTGRECVAQLDLNKPLYDITLNHTCSFQNFVYDVTAALTMTIDIRDEAIIGFKVFIGGTTTNTPIFAHAAELHFFTDDLAFDDGQPQPTLFQDTQGNSVFLASYGSNGGFPPSKLLATPDCKTLDCNWLLGEVGFNTLGRYFNDFKYDAALGVYNEPKLVLSYLFWIRDPGPTPASETGIIKGKLTDRLNSLAIRRANVYLNRQVEPIRSQLANESDLSYRTYLENTTTRLMRAPLGADGTFEFQDVPLFQHIESGADAWKSAAYTIEVVDAESDNTFLPGTPVIYYKTKMVHNIPPNDGSEPPVAIGLDAISSIAAKRDVATQLSNISTNNYRTIETNVLQHLARLESGDLPLTDEANEGVKRAFWAEALVREGSRQAEDLIKVMLRGLGETVADIVGRLLKNDASRGAKGKKMVTGAAASKLPNAKASEFKVDPKLSSAEIDQLARDGVNFVILDTVEKMFTWQAPLTEGALTKVGASKARAEAVSSFVKTVGKLLVASIKTATGLDPNALLSTFLGEVLKELINQTAPILFDNQVRLELNLPLGDPIRKDIATLESAPSYCKITAPELDFSAEKMRNWNRVDEPRYRADAANASQHLQELIDRGTEVKRLTIFAQATAKSAKTAGGVLGVAGTSGVSQAEIASKILKEITLFANGSTFAVPAAYLFHSSPQIVRNGAYAAYGEKPPSALLAQFASASQGSAAALPGVFRTDVEAAYRQFTNALAAVEASLRQDDIGAVLQAATRSDGLGNSYVALRDAAQQVSTAAAGRAPDSDGEGVLVALLMQDEIEFTFACDAVHQQLLDLLGNLFNDVYSGKTDAAYLSSRDEALRLCEQARQAASKTASGLTRWLNSKTSLSLKPAALVKVSPPVSTSTGKTELSASGETFTVKARIRNISSVVLSNLTARLLLPVPESVAKINSAAMVSVGNGSLAALDSLAGAGPDEAEVFWTFTYTGPGSNAAPLLVTVELFENGENPISFVSSAGTAALLPDLALIDPDGDGMPSAYEATVGLNPNLADGGTDADGDGLTALQEFLLRTDPRKKDTDADGLSDSEEVNTSKNGFATDPLIADTDGDAVLDGADGQPLNALASTPTTVKEPKVSLSLNTVTLSRTNPIVSIPVQNSGIGTLYWQAETDRAGIVQLSPQAPGSGSQGDVLTISLADPAAATLLSAGETRVLVTDIGGAVPDQQEILVKVLAEPPPAPAKPKPNITGVTLPSSGRIRITFEGTGGVPLRLETSNDLKTWTETYRANDYSGGRISLTETISAAQPYRFYRATQ